MFSMWRQSQRQEKKPPRNEQALIAHFEREAIPKWPDFKSSQHVLTNEEQRALERVRNAPYNDHGWMEAFCTFFATALVSTYVLCECSETPKNAGEAIVEASKKTVLTAAVTKTTQKSAALGVLTFSLFLANEVRVWIQQDHGAQASMWEEVADWPFTNAILQPLPTLVPATCQPMLEALTLLRETTADNNNKDDDGEKCSIKDMGSTACLLANPNFAHSLELRRMLEFAMECDHHYKAPANEHAMSRKKWIVDPSAPRKTLRDWLG